MLRGLKTTLREATEADRGKVYDWLAHSDLTPSIMGPPRFSDHPIPTWEEFCADYRHYYFDGSKPNHGQCFIIVANQTDVGVVCYNALRSDNVTDVDIWLRSEADCGKGFGSDALRTLTDYLNRQFAVTRVAVSPSARNQRAIAAYKKAGFHLVPTEKYNEFVKPEEMEYEDNVVLVKEYTHNNRFHATGYAGA
jgi:diamine N-acetyltransferase